MLDSAGPPDILHTSTVSPDPGTIERAAEQKHLATLFDPVRWGDGMAEQCADFALPLGTVTLLLADVEGSTGRWERRPDLMRASMARFDRIAREAVGTHGGVRPEEQGEGDSFVAAFARATDALAAAVSLQLALVREQWPAGGEVRVRVGIHTGEVQLRDGRNYIGRAVNRTARLRSLGHGGQTLVSQATAELVADGLPNGAHLTALGVHRLRDLSRPERVFQLDHVELPSQFPALRSLEHLPNNLPASLSSFVGRVRELQQVGELLHGTRLLTLTGAGGSGKTRLALQVAADDAERYPGGVWFVDLSSTMNQSEVGARVAAAMGVREDPHRPVVDVIAENVDSRVLFLLDNCEHVVDAAAALVEQLLAHIPDAVVLATSREALDVPGEVTWGVPPMTLPPPELPLTVAALSTSDAVSLFVDRARSVRPNFVLDDKATAFVTSICRRLDAIPLAIELAAARTRLLSVRQIAAGLDDRFRLLGVGPRTALPRQATLRASVEWSHDLLSEDEKTLFARLSVFAGGFDLDAAERVCGVPPLSALAVLDLLDSLAQKSLVAADPEHDRYSLLETLRHYARDRLMERAEAELLADRHLAHYAERLQWPPAGPNKGWRQRLRDEGDNVRAALLRAAAGGDPVAGLRLATHASVGWVVVGRFAEAARSLESILELEPIPDHVRAWGLWAHGWVASFAGDVMTQVLGSAQALPIARAAGDRDLTALCAGTLAMAQSTMNPAEGLVLAEEALASLDAAAGSFVRAHVHFLVGIALFNACDSTRALEQLDEAGAVAGDGHNLSSILGFKSNVVTMLGELAQARGVAAEALDHARRERFTFWEAQSLSLLGMLAALRGDEDDARALGEESISVAAQVNPGSLAMIRAVAAWAAVFGGDGMLGLEHAEQALGVLHAFSMRTFVVYAEAAAVEAAALLGDDDAGQRHLDVLMAMDDVRDRNWAATIALLVRARARRRHGDLEGFDADAHAALALSQEAGMRLQALLALPEVAAAAADAGSHEHAARLLGGSMSHAHTLGLGMRRLREWAETAAQVRAEVGERRYDDLAAEGAALSIDELSTYARRGRGERRRPASGWASLTPVELQVTALVKAGLTNKEIGARLFISPHTVRAHLSHVFTKLGVRTRSELAAIATERRL